LVLLHRAISTIEPSFGAVIPRVAQTRRLIAVEQQAHGGLSAERWNWLV